MSHKFLLLYISKDDTLVTRVLSQEKLEDEKAYETKDIIDLSARKRRDILVHHISPLDPDKILYVMTITTAKPSETIIGTQTATEFLDTIKDDKESLKNLLEQLVVFGNNGRASGQFDLPTKIFKK